jgi:hypothetical protein
MKRKVAQRETQRAYAHARSYSGSEQCYKMRRTGHTSCSAGVPRSTLPSSLRPLTSQRELSTKFVLEMLTNDMVELAIEERNSWHRPELNGITVLREKMQSTKDRLSTGSCSSCIPETPSPPLTPSDTIAALHATLPPRSEATFISERKSVHDDHVRENTVAADFSGPSATADVGSQQKTDKNLKHCPITGLPINAKLLKKLKAAPQVTLANALGWKSEAISSEWDRQALIVVS